MRLQTNRLVLFIGLVALLLLTGCLSLSSRYQPPTSTAAWSKQVASIFRDLYQRLGGEAALGAAISEPFNRGDGTACQYMEKVLMCYNPNADQFERIFLESIGYDVLGVPPVPPSPEIRVYDAFLPAYRDRFFGARYAGKPLTEVRYDSQQHRLVQYFEKMALALDTKDPKAQVQLLPYGVTLFRRDNPKASLPAGSSIGFSANTDIPSAAGLMRLGGLNALGTPLSKPYPEKDAISEQLFENALVYIPKENPNTVQLRNLPQRLGMPSSPPGTQIYTLKENMIFYITKGELGYHVPIFFDQFITTHGGLEFSGAPIAEPFAVQLDGKTIARQCFQNYCLDYDPAPVDGIAVHMAPIGRLYQQSLNPENQALILSGKTISITAAAQKTRLTNDQEQTISVQVKQNQNGKPLTDVESFITLNLPDGKRLSYNFPPTNSSGKTHLTLQPFYGASNAQIVPFIVCLSLPTEEPICSADSFMIWNLK